MQVSWPSWRMAAAAHTSGRGPKKDTWLQLGGVGEGSLLLLHMQAWAFSAATANRRGHTPGQYLAAAGCTLPLSSPKPAGGPAYASFAILVSAGQGAAEQGVLDES